ncbi:hypothetical protein BDW72DRAFT_186031 [Aspergillus terricola var. indicus]
MPCALNHAFHCRSRSDLPRLADSRNVGVGGVGGVAGLAGLGLRSDGLSLSAPGTGHYCRQRWVNVHCTWSGDFWSQGMQSRF